MAKKSYLRLRKKPFFSSLAAPPSGSMTPVQAAGAYQFPRVKSVRQVKIGILSLGGFYDDAATQAAFQGYGQPRPVVTVQGQQDTTDQDSTVENMLDVELAASAYTYCTGQPAQIVEDFEPNSAGSIANSIDNLVNAGCEVISCSWGSPLSQTPASEQQSISAAIARAKAKGVHFLAASGDNSLDDGTGRRTPDHPCCDENAWAVGGTRLLLNADGSIAQESAWGDGNAADEGGGGGFVPNAPQPPWQKGVVPGSLRGKPDSSANADPATGYNIVANGQWMSVGGTSASTPLTAGLLAAILSTMPGRLTPGALQQTLYAARQTAFRDVTLGSNGDPAVSGWDDATGLGSPNGPGMCQALTASGPVQPVPPPVQPTPPPVQPPQPPVSITAEVDAIFLAVEKRFWWSPQFVAILEQIRRQVDATLSAAGYHHLCRMGGHVPPGVIQIVDACMDAAALAWPQWALQIKAVKAVLDTFLPMA